MKTLRSVVPLFAAIALLSGCERDVPKAKPDAVRIVLAPEVISSTDGTLDIRATVIERNTPLKGWPVRISVDYIDRNGNQRLMSSSDGETDRTGSVEMEIGGLLWEGVGTVTAQVLDGDGQPYVGREDVPVESTATFSVLDRTPPVATIVPPAADLRVGPNLPMDFEVNFSDEIGVSRVTVQAVGELNDTDSRLVASGSTGGLVSFQMDVPGGAISGPTITLYALVEDLSGNTTAAAPVVLIVDPSILIAVPPGFTATKLVEGSATFLEFPTALAFSPMDGMLYVADNTGGAPCNGRCIRQVDPADGAVTAGAVANGVAAPILGVAFDATGDRLYWVEVERVRRLTWNAGASAYQTPEDCYDFTAGQLPEPHHLVIDGTDIVIADRSDQVLKVIDISVTDCDGTEIPADVGTGMSDPWGVVELPGGDYAVSDVNDDAIYQVSGGGGTSTYEAARCDVPMGVDWLAGGTSTYADSLFIANFGDQRVLSSTGLNQVRTAVSLRNDPVDLAFGAGAEAGSLFVLTDPGARGRIFKITGY